MKYLDNVITLLQGIYDNIGKPKIIDVTVADLCYLRDYNELIPGQQYRITDYQATYKGDVIITTLFNHYIIVTAINNNTLNENAVYIVNNVSYNIKYTLFNEHLYYAECSRYIIITKTKIYNAALKKYGKELADTILIYTRPLPEDTKWDLWYYEDKGIRCFLTLDNATSVIINPSNNEILFGRFIDVDIILPFDECIDDIDNGEGKGVIYELHDNINNNTYSYNICCINTGRTLDASAKNNFIGPLFRDGKYEIPVIDLLGSNNTIKNSTGITVGANTIIINTRKMPEDYYSINDALVINGDVLGKAN